MFLETDLRLGLNHHNPTGAFDSDGPSRLPQARFRGALQDGIAHLGPGRVVAAIPCPKLTEEDR